MPELNQVRYPIQSERPLLLQKTSLAEVSSFNVFIEQSRITKQQQKNPENKNENIFKILANQIFVDKARKEDANKRRLNTSDKIYYGSSNPYPETNNFLANARNGNKTDYEK